MKIFCPCCHGLVGHLAGPGDADAHYPGGCPFCHGSTAAASTIAAADKERAANGSHWVDEDGDIITEDA